LRPAVGFGSPTPPLSCRLELILQSGVMPADKLAVIAARDMPLARFFMPMKAAKPRTMPCDAWYADITFILSHEILFCFARSNPENEILGVREKAILRGASSDHVKVSGPI
jgi:hypothetical protein